jgi:CubicO group peptidase (beta-lactamase class C family)
MDVDLKREGTAWSGDITIAQQNARDVPLGDISVRGDSVSFSIPGAAGGPTFDGVLSASGDSLVGTLRQGRGGVHTFALGRAAGTAQATTAALDGFDAFITQAMKDWKVPGMAIAIVRDGQVVHSRGYGLRDVEGNRPVTPQTLFAIGSSTKAFTTFALGRMVDQGKMGWDEPAITYLPGLRLQDEYATAHLTPRDMVTHRSGLPRHDLTWYNNSGLTPEVLFTRLSAFEPTQELRGRFQYNNVMYVMAGHMLSRLTGKPWEESIREMVLQPLGMRSTNFSVAESQRAADFAYPYVERRDTVRRVPFRDIGGVGPAGAINSSVEDMARWVMVHLNGGRAGGEQLINAATLREMHTPQMVIPGVPSDPDLSPQSYGMGWFVDSYRGHYRVHHGGNIDGFSALVTLFPNDNAGIVVLTNKNATRLPELAVRHLADRLFALPAKDWSGQALARLERVAGRGARGRKARAGRAPRRHAPRARAGRVRGRVRAPRLRHPGRHPPGRAAVHALQRHRRAAGALALRGVQRPGEPGRPHLHRNEAAVRDGDGRAGGGGAGAVRAHGVAHRVHPPPRRAAAGRRLHRPLRGQLLAGEHDRAGHPAGEPADADGARPAHLRAGAAPRRRVRHQDAERLPPEVSRWTRRVAPPRRCSSSPTASSPPSAWIRRPRPRPSTPATTTERPPLRRPSTN